MGKQVKKLREVFGEKVQRSINLREGVSPKYWTLNMGWIPKERIKKHSKTQDRFCHKN